jgi:putative membrane protein
MTASMTTVLAGGWHHGDVGIGWWIVMMLGMILFWGAIIALAVWALRGGIGQRQPKSEAPEEILRRRLADGSITIEQYEQRRGTLDAAAARSGSAFEEVRE